MSTRVPPQILNELVLLGTYQAQITALNTERDAWADECLAHMKWCSARWSDQDLFDAINGFRVAYGDGWTKRLATVGLPTLKQLRATMLGACNDGEGRWRGPFPLAEGDVRPPLGTWVVYQLTLAGELVYIGSSGQFATRVKAHARDKSFDGWRASHCANEAECRDLETALIDRYRPPLNRMIPTPRMVLS